MNAPVKDVVADLMREYRALDDFVKAENKRLAEHLKPSNERLAAIETELHKFLLDNGVDSVKRKGLGTAYISEIMNVKVDNPEAALDYALDNWDQCGQDIVSITPKKDFVRSYMNDHTTQTPQGPVQQTPPGISISYFKRCNFRRT